MPFDLDRLSQNYSQILDDSNGSSAYRNGIGDLVLWHVVVASLVHITMAGVWELTLKEKVQLALDALRTKPLARDTKETVEKVTEELEKQAGSYASKPVLLESDKLNAVEQSVRDVLGSYGWDSQKAADTAKQLTLILGEEAAG